MLPPQLKCYSLSYVPKSEEHGVCTGSGIISKLNFQKKAERGWGWARLDKREVENIVFSAHAPLIKACLLGNCGCHCHEDWMQNGRGPITVSAKHKRKRLVLPRIYHSDCAEFLNDMYLVIC